jgi:outer membrane protein
MKIRTVLIAGALMLASTVAAAQSVKVGYINLTRIEKESAAAVRATEALRQEFEPRNQEISELQKRIAAAQGQFENEKARLSPLEAQAKGREIADMMRQSDQMVTRLREDFEQRKSELGVGIFEDTRAAIKAVADAGNFDLILQEVVYARPGVDITDQVLKEMAKRAGAAR